MEQIIPSSFYEIQEKLLDLSKTFLIDENGNSLDLNTLKSGFFGWTIEALSEIAMDDIVMKTLIQDERFLNTASLSKSIYSFAMDIGLDNSALPSFGKGYISFDFLDVSQALAKKGQDKLRLDKNISFDVDGKYKLMLPYEIVIDISTATPIASYDLSKPNIVLDSLNIQTPYLTSSFFYDEDGRVQLLVQVFFVQIERVFKSFIFKQNNLATDNETLVPFANQFAGLNVLYSENGLDYTQLEKFLVNYPLDFNDSERKFCTYEIVDSQISSVKFPYTTGGFKPAVNSIIDIEIFTTLGKNGNFSYSGGINFNLLDSDYSSIKRNAGFLSTTESMSGGINRLTLDQLKTSILMKRTNPDGHVITERNINDFFKEKFYNTDLAIKLIKIQNDNVERSFNFFTTFKDSNGYLIPTNTVDIRLTDTTITENVVLSAGNYVILKKRDIIEGVIIDNIESRLYSEEFKLMPLFEDDPVPVDGKYDIAYYSSEDYFVYRLPYSIGVNIYPFEYLNFYRSLSSESIAVKITDLSPHNYNQLVIIKFNMNRTTFNSNQYDFSFNINFKNIVTNEFVSNILLDVNELSVKLLFYTIDSDSKKVHLFNTTCSKTLVNGSDDATKIVECTSTVITTNNFTNGKLDLISEPQFELYKTPTLSDTNPFVSSQVDGSLISVEEEVYIDILVSQKLNNLLDGQVIAFKPELDLDISTIETANYELMPEKTSGYTNILKVSSVTSARFYNNVNNIMKADIIKDEDGLLLTKVPVVGSDFYEYSEQYNYFLDMLDNYERLLESIYFNLEESFRINFKFFNTFGNSKFLSTRFVNNQIELDIVLKNNVLSSIVDKKIKEYLVSTLESFNNLSNPTIYLSNITTALESNFDEIESADVNTVNGDIIKKIEFLDGYTISSLEHSIKYVPEYINIGYDYSDTTSENYNKYSIKINYSN